MAKYQVKITPKAMRDLDSIYKYIAYDKFALDSALRQRSRIKNAILSLADFPHAHQERVVGRYTHQGYRQLVIDNYLVIFRIVEEDMIVYIITVQHQRRNI